LLPTACVLWLINNAVSNQRHIARQQLTDAYRTHLRLVRERIDEHWEKQARKLAELAETGTAARAFGAAVREGVADAAVAYGENGRVVYPGAPALPTTTARDTPEWVAAQALENTSTLRAAAEAYASIAARTSDLQLGARALQAQIRCLRQLPARSEAIKVLLDSFAGPKYRSAVDAQGRSIAADQLLLGLHSLPSADPRRKRLAHELHTLLQDYQEVALPAAQRVFIMKEMLALEGAEDVKRFPTLRAEELAAAIAGTRAAPVFDGQLRRGPLADTWVLGAPNGRIAGVFRTSTVKMQVERVIEKQALPPNVRIAVLESEEEGRQAIDTAPAGVHLAGWRLGLMTDGTQPFNELASRQMALYVWTGALMVAGVLGLAVFAWRAIQRQVVLAGLKSDLVATVSHELKTPLASMQLLVDTLLEQPDEPRRTREYLEMIGRENARLTRLVENFLTFSRLERSRYQFRFADIAPSEVVCRAREGFADRASEAGVNFTVDVAPGLPAIHGDAGALATAVANLLDNAYKYSGDEKKIALRAFSQNGSVYFEVEDNGVGVPEAEASRIFRKFYQVDDRLARSRGGCGLGLSIVKFIADAHRASTGVRSTPGAGSVFSLGVPVSKT
jgi:signal transduction histidine kinase